MGWKHACTRISIQIQNLWHCQAMRRRDDGLEYALSDKASMCPPNALQDLSIDPADSRFQPSVLASLHPQEMRESNGVLASSRFEAGKYRIKRNHQAAKVLQVTVILNV